MRMYICLKRVCGTKGILVLVAAGERQLVQQLSLTGAAVDIIRGRRRTQAAAVEALLRDGNAHTAIIVDVACPGASRLLDLVRTRF